MYRFEGLDIEVTGGDSLVFAVRFDGRAVPVGSTAVFTVKKRLRERETVIEKRYAVADNRVVVALGAGIRRWLREPIGGTCGCYRQTARRCARPWPTRRLRYWRRLEMADAEMSLQIEDWRGYSAYELAVMHGYAGTESEWVESLKGEPGRDGEGITVNGREPVNGDIALTGAEIPLSGEDETPVSSRLEALLLDVRGITDAEIDGILEG